ncbi:MAG: BtaA family protein [Acidobacteriota bacterium]|nr:MAG: BtaA family protein [Acidobacteriota bacterium]
MTSAQSSRLLRDAVASENGRSREGLLQRLFSVWFDAFVYNQIWEDPRVDLKALALDGDSRVLTISSGGCNAMNYLLAGPRSVTAVDLNRHHIALLKLKIAALSVLPDHEDFFAFFGKGSGERNIENFDKFIAPALDEETREYWEGTYRIKRGRRIDLFTGRGIYDHSRNGYFLRFFHALSRKLGCDPEAVLKAKNIEEQKELYEKHIAPFFDSKLIRAIGKMPVTLFGLGIPPQQYEELKKDVEGEGTVIDIYRERTERLAAGFPIEDNYFAWQALARRYDTEHGTALPEYLKEDNYDRLRSMADRISAKVGSVTDEIRDNPEGAFNRFVFLDAQDWMKPPMMTELWGLIAKRSEPGARIIFRTAGRHSPIEGALPADLRKRFEYHEELSRELFKEDRASIYGGFHLYTLR